MLNLPDPSQTAMGGVSSGLKLAGLAQQIQQGRVAQETQAQQRQALEDLRANPNPTAKDFTNVAMLLPKDQADSLRSNWEALNKEKQENNLKFSGQVLSAFQSGSPEIGINLLSERAAAERNAGNEEGAKAYETYAKIAEINPDSVFKTIGTMVAAVPGGDKVIESVTKLGGAGIKGQEIDIERQKLDLRRTENQLRAMESGLKRETNELKKEELQQNIEKKRQDLDQKKREIVAESETSYKNTSNALALTDDILTNVDIDAISGLQALTPTVLPETQDALNKVMQLKNQLTLDNLKLMTGVLTDRDIQVLSSAASGLIVDEKGIKGSPEGVKKQLKKIRDTLRGKLDIAGKGLEKVKKDFGIQANEEAPAGAVSQEVLNRMQKYLIGGQ